MGGNPCGLTPNFDKMALEGTYVPNAFTCQPVKLPGYRVDALTDAAIRYIDDHKDHPFFLFVSYLEPHFQNSNDSFPPPDVDFKRAYGYIPPDLGAIGGTAWQHLSGYYGMVKRLDAALGRINDALKSLGLQDDTIVLFTSDHGCHFKTRNREYKRSCHESSIHIPMALNGGPFISGGSMRQLISLNDIAPTLLDADIRNDSRADRYTETFLYDLEHDPWELHNLIHSGGHEGVCEVLREKMHAYMHRAGEDAEIIPVEKKQEGKLHAFEGEEYL